MNLFLFYLLIAIPVIGIPVIFYILISRSLKKRSDRFQERLENPETREDAQKELTRGLKKMAFMGKYIYITKIVGCSLLFLMGLMLFVISIGKIFSGDFELTIKGKHGMGNLLMSLIMFPALYVVLKSIKDLKEYKKSLIKLGGSEADVEDIRGRKKSNDATR